MSSILQCQVRAPCLAYVDCRTDCPWVRNIGQICRNNSLETENSGLRQEGMSGSWREPSFSPCMEISTIYNLYYPYWEKDTILWHRYWHPHVGCGNGKISPTESGKTQGGVKAKWEEAILALKLTEKILRYRWSTPLVVLETTYFLVKTMTKLPI